jgi:hypothetical protein
MSHGGVSYFWSDSGLNSIDPKNAEQKSLGFNAG